MSKENKENFLKSIFYDKIMEEFDFCEDKIYFENFRLIIWTNYNKQIILFFEKQEDFINHRNTELGYKLNIVFEKE